MIKVLILLPLIKEKFRFVLGIVYDATGSYDASFHFAGSLILLSGLVSCIIPTVHKIERSKLKNEGLFAAIKEFFSLS